MRKTLTIVIKALNEEENIARAIESCLKVKASIDAEVFLVDCLSSDRTVDIASTYPINIIQIDNVDDRTCGVGGHVAFQYVNSEYLYMMDGDMELEKEFIDWGLEFLEKNVEYAGVGGSLIQYGGGSYEFKVRDRQLSKVWCPGDVRWLVGGGLYRCSALNDIGNFTNLNLHAYEEMELGLRLENKGWKLYRSERNSVKHHAHLESSIQLMRKRWEGRYVDGAGELIRMSIGHPYFFDVIWEFRIYVGFLLLIFTNIILTVVLILEKEFFRLVLIYLFDVALLLMFVARKRSFLDSIYSILNMFTYSAGLIRGLFVKERHPNSNVKHKILKIDVA